MSLQFYFFSKVKSFKKSRYDMKNSLLYIKCSEITFDGIREKYYRSVEYQSYLDENHQTNKLPKDLILIQNIESLKLNKRFSSLGSPHLTLENLIVLKSGLAATSIQCSIFFSELCQQRFHHNSLPGSTPRKDMPARRQPIGEL